MSQLNVNLNPDFERDLADFMLIRGIRSKSEAVRIAVQESLQRSRGTEPAVDFASWLGAACGPDENPSPRFRRHQDVWAKP